MKFSIITATLNSAPFLEECIASVRTQGHEDFEHIIADGGSTDATVAIARRYPHLTVVERPGCSIYEAWNIGLDVATGDLYGICNSDDLYPPQTFARVLGALRSNPEAWLVTGKAIEFTRDAAGNTAYGTEYVDKKNSHLRLEDFNIFGPALNARFFTRKLITRLGKFDTRFRLGSDCSYMMDIALADLPVAHVDDVFYLYRSHARSSSLGGNTRNATISLDEKLTIGGEYIASGRLDARQLRHLRRAMAMQFASTVIECTRAGRWRDAFVSLRCMRRLSARENIALLRNASIVASMLALKRVSKR